MQLSDFERNFIAAMAESDPQRNIIHEQLGQASVVSRDYTGVGLYTKLSVPNTSPRLNASHWKSDDRLHCSGEHPDLPAGAGFILWVEDGYIACLESYTYDGNWPANESLFRPAV